jgi:hypothetical protein
MISIIAQRIGIFYKDLEWVRRIFDEILSMIPEDAIKMVRKSKFNLIAGLKDGTTIECIKVRDGIRGKKFDKILMQQGIEAVDYNTIIAPCFLGIYSMPVVIMEDGSLRRASYYYIDLMGSKDTKDTKEWALVSQIVEGAKE